MFQIRKQSIRKKRLLQSGEENNQHFTQSNCFKKYPKNRVAEWSVVDVLANQPTFHQLRLISN